MDTDYPPLPVRRRLLVVLLTVATTLTLWFMLIYRPGDSKRDQPRQQPAPAECSQGRSSGCVGGKADIIIVAPGAVPASAP